MRNKLFIEKVWLNWYNVCAFELVLIIKWLIVACIILLLFWTFYVNLNFYFYDELNFIVDEN